MSKNSMKKHLDFLKNQVNFMKSQDLNTLKNSYDKLDQLKNGVFMSSSITITLKDMKGNNILEETAIFDGLTNETIELLKQEIKKTYNLKIDLNKIKS